MRPRYQCSPSSFMRPSVLMFKVSRPSTPGLFIHFFCRSCQKLFLKCCHTFFEYYKFCVSVLFKTGFYEALGAINTGSAGARPRLSKRWTEVPFLVR